MNTRSRTVVPLLVLALVSNYGYHHRVVAAFVQVSHNAKTTLPTIRKIESDGRFLHLHTLSHHHNLDDSDDDTTTLTAPQSINSPLSRRHWISLSGNAAAAATIASTFPQPTQATVETTLPLPTTTTTPPPPPLSALCDPSVSTWKRGTRIVHILGTAHISADSAATAGRLVRETRPNGVFVELDAKRVGRAFASPKDGSGEGGSVPEGVGTGYVVGGESRGGGTAVVTRSERDGGGGTGGEEVKGWRRFNPFGAVQRAGTALVGDALRGLYKKLESQGFSAGEEFVVAVREGLNLGSTIILGDRDVDVTLDRITTALRKTDLRKLLSTDSEFEKSIEQMLPGELKTATAKGTELPEAEQLSLFVETLKAKETVRALMAEVKRAAPELYVALVQERDEYMANGIDNLNQFESMVAVMGMAHVDGVEMNLASRGWQPVNAKCPLRV